MRCNRGHEEYWRALEFLNDLRRMKKPRVKAQRLLLSWACLKSAASRRRIPENATKLLAWIEEAIRHSFSSALWYDELDAPFQKRLSKAKSDAQIDRVAKAAIKEWEQFVAAVSLESTEVFNGLDVNLFEAEWFKGEMLRRLDSWRSRLVVVQPPPQSTYTVSVTMERHEPPVSSDDLYCCPSCQWTSEELVSVCGDCGGRIHAIWCPKCDFGNPEQKERCGRCWWPLSNIFGSRRRLVRTQSVTSNSDLEDVFPFVMWCSVGNGAPGFRDVRWAHAILHGKVFAVSGEFVKRFEPPTDVSCRCHFRSILRTEVSENNLPVFMLHGIDDVGLPILRNIKTSEIIYTGWRG